MKKFGFLILVFIGAFIVAHLNRPRAVEVQDYWTTDLSAARVEAKKTGKSVLIDFSGSDWCKWCIQLDREVFAQPEFIEYAKENLICVLVDFPRRTELPPAQKAINDAIAETYHVEGFPTVLILNSNGRAIKRTGYQRGGPNAYIEMIQEAIAPNS